MAQLAERTGTPSPLYEEMKSRFPYSEKAEINPNLALLLGGRVLIDCWEVRDGRVHLTITSDYDYTAIREDRLVRIRNLQPGTHTITKIDFRSGRRVVMIGTHYWVRVRDAGNESASLSIRSAITPFSLRSIPKDESYGEFVDAFMNQNFPPKPK